MSLLAAGKLGNRLESLFSAAERAGGLGGQRDLAEERFDGDAEDPGQLLDLLGAQGNGAALPHRIGVLAEAELLGGLGLERPAASAGGVNAFAEGGCGDIWQGGPFAWPGCNPPLSAMMKMLAWLST